MGPAIPTGIFSAFGSGLGLRQKAEASAVAVREEDAALTIGNSPAWVSVDDLGSKLLFSVRGMKLLVRSLEKGKDETRIYPLHFSAKILTHPLGLIHRLDRESFLAYVYNFKNIVVDIHAKTQFPVSPEQARALVVEARANSALAPRSEKVSLELRLAANTGVGVV